MEIDPNAVGSLYRTLAGAVIPRPIAWVSSRNTDGVENLAPYSFFNVVSLAPPILMFSAADGRQVMFHSRTTSTTDRTAR